MYGIQYTLILNTRIVKARLRFDAVFIGLTVLEGLIRLTAYTVLGPLLKIRPSYTP
jgi:hypothetical protein